MIMIIRLSTKLNFRSLSIRKYVIQEIVEPRQKARAAEKEVAKLLLELVGDISFVIW